MMKSQKYETLNQRRGDADDLDSDEKNVESSASFKPAQLRLIGFCNQGNTCYMNSALQCFHRILPLSSFFITYHEKLAAVAAEQKRQQDTQLANALRHPMKLKEYAVGTKIMLENTEGIYEIVSVVYDDAESNVGNHAPTSESWQGKGASQRSTRSKIFNVRRIDVTPSDIGSAFHVAENAIAGQALSQKEVEEIKHGKWDWRRCWSSSKEFIQSLVTATDQDKQKHRSSLLTSWCRLVGIVDRDGVLPAFKSKSSSYNDLPVGKYEPRDVKRHLGEYGADFKDYEQHDAWMAFLTLLNGLQTELGKEYPKNEPQFDFSLYTGMRKFCGGLSPDSEAAEFNKAAKFCIKQQLKKCNGKSPFVHAVGGVRVGRAKCLSCCSGFERCVYSYFQHLQVSLMTDRIDVVLLIPALAHQPFVLKHVASDSPLSLLRHFLAAQMSFDKREIASLLLDVKTSAFCFFDTERYRCELLDENSCLVKQLHKRAGCLLLLPISSKDGENIVPTLLLKPNGDVSMRLVALTLNDTQKVMHALYSLVPRDCDIDYVLHKDMLLRKGAHKHSFSIDVARTDSTPLLIVLKAKSDKLDGNMSDQAVEAPGLLLDFMIAVQLSLTPEQLANLFGVNSDEPLNLPAYRSGLAKVKEKAKDFHKQVSSLQQTVSNLSTRYFENEDLDRFKRKVADQVSLARKVPMMVQQYQELLDRIQSDIEKAQLGAKEAFRTGFPAVNDQSYNLTDLQQAVDLQYGTTYITHGKSTQLECPDCGQSTVISEAEEIIRCPEYLLLHLNRGSFEGSCKRHGKDKLNDPLQFPIDNLRVRTFRGPQMYKLVAASMHSGSSVKGGHYTAFVRDNVDSGAWFYCNDSWVSVASGAPNERASYNAVFLVYQQSE